MFQPFFPMNYQVAQKLKIMGNHYLVTQSYERGRDDMAYEGKEPLLMSDYSDSGLARIHYNAIPENDKYRFILDITNEKHMQKLQEMISPDSKYIVFVKRIRFRQEELDKYLKEKYFDNVSRYIVMNTKWHLGKNKFITRLEVIFGELYLEIKLHNEKVRAKFTDIERS